MHILQFKKAMLLLPVVLALGITSVSGNMVLALGTLGSMWSGMPTLETLSLEEDLAVVSSSADQETADKIAEDVVLPSTDTIAIHAISPGYTTDAGKNSGELIELVKISKQNIDLSGLSIIYTAKPTSTESVGKSTVLYEFPIGSKMIGESILLRYNDSPEVLAAITDDEHGSFASVADLTYSTSLAMYGSLSLIYKDTPNSTGEVISAVCWLGGENCLPYFSTTVKSRSYTTIVRNDDTGDYYHTNEPNLLFQSLSPGLFLPPSEVESDEEADINTNDSEFSRIFADITLSPCFGLRFSEILSYYTDEPSEQFIEIINSSNHVISLSRCAIRYKSKNYKMILDNEDYSLAADDYYVINPNPMFRLTKNPTTENLLELVDVGDGWGDDYVVVASLAYPHGQKKSAAYAMIGYNSYGEEEWQTTFLPTPGSSNIPQEFKTCPAGKIINELTGNCVNASTLSTLLKDCGEGKYRNPETGRCKSYNDSGETNACKEGYERNPETGRCRKIKDNNGADYPLVPITGVEERSSFIAIWAIVGIGAIGLGYVVFQFRKEIVYFTRRIIAKIKK